MTWKTKHQVWILVYLIAVGQTSEQFARMFKFPVSSFQVNASLNTTIWIRFRYHPHYHTRNCLNSHQCDEVDSYQMNSIMSFQLL